MVGCACGLYFLALKIRRLVHDRLDENLKHGLVVNTFETLT
jgi:hypothetical protein